MAKLNVTQAKVLCEEYGLSTVESRHRVAACWPPKLAEALQVMKTVDELPEPPDNEV